MLYFISHMDYPALRLTALHKEVPELRKKKPSNNVNIPSAAVIGDTCTGNLKIKDFLCSFGFQRIISLFFNGNYN